MNMNYAVYTSVGDEKEAQKIAEAAVEQGLAACAQIDKIESFYRWQGKVEHEPEFRVLFKISEGVYPKLEKLIKSLHSYEEAAIHAVKFETGSPSYLKWIDDNSKM